MNRRFFFGLAFTFLLWSVPGPSSALEVPPHPDGYISDRAELLSPSAKAQLEAMLRDFEVQTSNQVVVATFPSLEGESLEDFSIQLAEAWKIGQQGKDNGVIFLIFKLDRKMRIEVGYGLESVLSDALAGQIIRDVVTPHFRQGRMETGIAAGLAAILEAIEGEYQGSGSSGDALRRRTLTPAELKALQRQSARILVLLLGVAAVLFAVDLFRYHAYRKTHQTHPRRYSFWEWFFRFALLVAIVSLLFRIFFYMLLFSRGGYGSHGRGGGGFSGGGGRFGGGGASGGW